MLDKHSLAELADIYKEKYNRLLKDNAELEMQIDEANMEVERLRAERDEARRRVCEMLHEEGYGRSPEEWAKRKGWDCFKENKEKTNGYR